MKRILITAIIIYIPAIISIGGGMAGNDASRELARAYSEQRWGTVRELLAKEKNSPRNGLFQSFYNLGYAGGDRLQALKTLKSLTEDDSTPQDIKRQAMLTRSRAIDLMQQRLDLYPDANSLGDPCVGYAAIIKEYPSSKEACYAVIYKSRRDAKMADLEKFLAAPELRCKELLGVVHWFAANQYIALKRDYTKAVEHLLAADEYGIDNPRFLSEIRFQIPRLYELKLKDPKKATIYYRRYVKLYPASVYSLNARKAIKRLTRENAQ